MTARCTTDDLCNFLQALHDAEEFIPVSLVQVRKLPPFRNQSTPDLLRVDIECSVFFRLTDADVKVPIKTTAPTLRPGA